MRRAAVLTALLLAPLAAACGGGGADRAAWTRGNERLLATLPPLPNAVESAPHRARRMKTPDGRSVDAYDLRAVYRLQPPVSRRSLVRAVWAGGRGWRCYPVFDEGPDLRNHGGECVRHGGNAILDLDVRDGLVVAAAWTVSH